VHLIAYTNFFLGQENLSSAAISNYKAGAETENAFDQKVDQYTKTRFKQLTTAQLRVLAADYRGGLSSCSIGYGQEIIERELCKPQIPKSVLASRFRRHHACCTLQHHGVPTVARASGCAQGGAWGFGRGPTPPSGAGGGDERRLGVKGHGVGHT
jgi:hypothetical protein